jgi:hypothetical protein
MSDDNTQGGAEPSPASDGSHGDGMVARLRSWRDERGYPTPGEMLDEAAAEIERLRLTDAEREAIWTVAEAYAENDGDPECERIARIMQGLWQRTK